MSETKPIQPVVAETDTAAKTDATGPKEVCSGASKFVVKTLTTSAIRSTGTVGRMRRTLMGKHGRNL